MMGWGTHPWMSSDLRHWHQESWNKLSSKGRVPSGNNVQSTFRNHQLGLSEPRDKERSGPGGPAACLRVLCTPQPNDSQLVVMSRAPVLLLLNLPGTTTLPSPQHLKQSVRITGRYEHRVLLLPWMHWSNCQTLTSILFTRRLVSNHCCFSALYLSNMSGVSDTF